MFLQPSKKLFYSSAVLIVLAITAVVIYPSDPIDYNTEVKPILNKKCITCHGGVKQEAGFSLLFEEEAFAPTKSGKPAIIKFKPEESELIRRLHLTDPEERMPYKHDPLTKEEIKLNKKKAKLLITLSAGSKITDNINLLLLSALVAMKNTFETVTLIVGKMGCITKELLEFESKSDFKLNIYKQN